MSDELFEPTHLEETPEPTVLETERARPSWLRRMVSRLFFLGVGMAVLAEGVLQLPPVRERIRQKAEVELQKKIPAATIRRCAAADLTGVVRFDGVSVPAGPATVVLDGLEISARLLPLLARRQVVLERVIAQDVSLRAGPLTFGSAPGGHFGMELTDPAHLDQPHLVLDGDAAACREPKPDSDAVRRCIAGHGHLELAVTKEAGETLARFQAIGDGVRLQEGSESVGMPPLGAHGTIHHKHRPLPHGTSPAPLAAGTGGETALDAELSVGPRGTVDATLTVEGDNFDLNVDASTETYAALVESLPLGLHEIHDLGVDGPVKAHAHITGQKSDPESWSVEMKLDLARLRARSRAHGAGAALRAPFTYHPTADPDVPPAGIRMARENPNFIPLDALPAHVIEAVLLSEDSEFFNHPGFDVVALVNAFKMNLRADKVKRGGSTITQQLAKNLWLTRDRTFRRKLEEALLTIGLEAAVPKDRILEIYLNGIEWGPGVYGIRPAARHYFGKDATELTPKEAAFLGTIIPNPRYYYVYYRRGSLTENWNTHVNAVLNKMHDAGILSDAAWSAGADTPIRFRSSRPDAWSEDVPSSAP